MSFASLPYSEVFEELFPYYLTIGMTPEQYWDGDPMLCKHYRKAQELKIEQRNQELWLQGMYIYEALCDVSPILQAFAKKGTKPIPYTKEPYPLSEKQRRRLEQQKARETAHKGMKFMEAMMTAFRGKQEKGV